MQECQPIAPRARNRETSPSFPIWEYRSKHQPPWCCARALGPGLSAPWTHGLVQIIHMHRVPARCHVQGPCHAAIVSRCVREWLGGCAGVRSVNGATHVTGPVLAFQNARRVMQQQQLCGSSGRRVHYAARGLSVWGGRKVTACCRCTGWCNLKSVGPLCLRHWLHIRKFELGIVVLWQMRCDEGATEVRDALMA
ncbi:hypothetical protein EJ04DRAFT_218237 [Polyplosphaeria fusca]|uniref:Uncharacterized protein n=1 Tax=Polyplosphaeria fusca TaxID=682080 RepID=A0A9P4QYS4_9PLEO|nr:hypothetical protein EJ04DRAFT_218237 [Polyplosphaeria fusca]